ncbi:MAG: hypothetical protein CMJ89_07555 [Planctomycetes bacterium]|jgi:UDP-N-acetylglucosamine/UDP-N-acetylgalactosamine diphosphorylase|nr:hypothetical protein [Planctomycetota bacterium]
MLEVPEELGHALSSTGQEHAFAYLERLEGRAHADLVRSLSQVDLAHMVELGKLARTPPASSAGHDLAPPELFPLKRTPQQELAAGEAIACGEELFAAGKVGFVLVAGGQASRLGYDAPKGDFPVGPVTGRTLFEYHAHRLLAARRRYGMTPAWYVMTSPTNDAATREIFQQNRHYGVNPEDVFFFSQEMLPALDAKGRILFATPESLFLAPNGHGGSLLALKRSGALADMRARGIEEISYFQVDNPLVRPADPLFAGLHAQAGCGMSSKVVKKIAAEEKVGVLGRIDGRLGCIEYSDLPEDLKTATDAQGLLSFRAGNIAVHMLRVDFVAELTDEGLELPWHVARKRMSSAAPDGAITECDGFKFETFVFDALGRSPQSVTLEVDRTLEFSSVKNAEGTDSPKSCRADLGNMFARWVAAAGDEIPPVNEAGYPPIEIDPFFAETQAEFVARTDRKPLRRKGGLVYESSE